MDKIYNGKITSLDIGTEDHDELIIMIMIEHERGKQGFGGWRLYCPKFDKVDRAGWFIWRVIETVLNEQGGRWKHLIDEPVRVKIKDNGFGTIRAIGNFLEDRWFSPKEELEKLAEDRKQNEKDI